MRHGGLRSVGRGGFRRPPAPPETLIHSFDPDTFADLSALLADDAVIENYRENAGGAAYGGVGEGILSLEAGGLEGRKFARILYADTTSWTGFEVFDSAPTVDRTMDYTNRLDINTPEAEFRNVSTGAFRLRRHIRFSENFQTVPSWGEGAPDHKVWRIFAHPVSGLYWSLKIGAGVTAGGDGAVKFGHPASSGTLEMVSTEFDVNSAPEVLASTYWDNAWHSAELRVYGLGTTAGITEWYLDDVLVFRVTGQDYTAYTGVNHYLCYANKNSGQSADITMDVDRILAYRIDS